MKPELLDENGFVFIDDNSRPFWCRMWGDAPWFFYWNGDKRWVSLRQVNQTEVWLANEKKIPQEQAEMYHKLNFRDQ